ncbi:MAG: RNB domain-containing ribonuclease, partial [Bacilli bacterium]
MAKHRYKHLHDKIIANLEKNNFSQTFIYEILHYMTTTFEKSNFDHILEHFDFCKDAFFYLQNGIIVNDRKIDSDIRDLILELSIVLEAKKFSFQKKSLLEIKNIDIFLEYSYELQKNLYGFKIIDEKKYNEIYQTILYNRNVLLSKYLLNFYFQQLQKDKELNNFVVELIKKYEFTIEQTKDNEEDYNYFSLILDYIIELYNEGLSKNYINSILNNIYKNLIVSKNQNIIMYLEDIKNKIEKLNNKTKKRITVFNNSDFNKLSNILNYSSNNNDFYYDENIITIDPPQAENLDDALSLKIDNKGNYEVGLYITDVSSEIMFGTNLDAMAFESFQSHNRKCSIFPKEISLGKCSLLPEQNRKIVACFIKFNQNGDMLSYEFNKGYINI